MKYDTAIFDLDGVLCTGRFLYSAEGKRFKEFGPDDSLALKKLRQHMKVHIISGDERSWDISDKRVRDMGFVLNHCPCEGREKTLAVSYDLDKVIYMGDSFTDIRVSQAAGYSICPADASPELKKVVDYVCEQKAAHRAVAEAVFHIYDILGLSILGDLV